MTKCELCEKPDEIIWRLQEVEQRTKWLFGLLITTALSSFGTLVGVIVLLWTNAKL